MSAIHEFHYRMPSRTGGYRPGSHHGSSVGGGQAFATHARLFDHPDPRRLDLRASLRHVGRDWLVRMQRQRTAVTVHAVVDVSASMSFGSRRAKLEVVGDFVDSLGRSAFRVGDAVGLLAFDTGLRDDLMLPARHHRGAGAAMRAMLSEGGRPALRREGDGATGLRRAAERLSGRQGLVFVVSDFHWPLDTLRASFDLLMPALLVPIVVWDPFELEAPQENALMMMRDAESNGRRTLWMRPALRAQWRNAVAQRRARIDALCTAHGVRPFYLTGPFDPQALSRYFLELTA
ncbi:DUF58 domain-containing protein [Paraburkholderia sp. DD10]|jgi:hypothetical protein|uniref:DUF58 domain-containing protein n=1 Tax=Paraburkholderia terricola TaxID=169427 RepID=A0A1M6REM5_9BURK|nr:MULTISPECIES: VWA domain-containing protein [Paraburkholderia]AXE96370.1 MxaS protein [Paraburkholderia terricola]ORC45367.1 MxaS protein [Burkholderia sp. A27]SDO99859.1 hypothetical protein SAMN05192547_103627 [Paraburkholderia sediminicola]SHK30902.1 hypothetical protein SAMN05192548_101888 [Paraburkholderia terricola]